MKGLDFISNVNQDFDIALEETGYGKFHFLLITVSGMIYMNTAIAITIVSFVLPSAECDFELTSEDKGWLTAMPMLGMVLGSYFWGCLADTKGRKIVLITSLLMDGIVGILSSLSPYFWLFLLFRFFNGFAITGAMGIGFPYLGEFQPSKFREMVLCWMELFWTVGVILLPGIAWMVIPIDIHFVTDFGFRFGSWNLFVLVCALPSVFLGFWLFWFPESPKFLMESGEPDMALEILRDIYSINTGKDRMAFPILSLREKKRALSVVSMHSTKSVRELDMTKPFELKLLLWEIWEQTKCLFKPPHLKNTLLTCTIQFGLTTSYYTLMIWFPDLFDRFSEYEMHHPGESMTVCEVAGGSNSTAIFKCTPIDPQVYLHTLIIGLSCIPTSFWLPLCVHRLGAKFFLISTLVTSGLSAIGISFISGSTWMLVLSCVFEALTSLSISLVYCVMVELFPTNLRVMAAALGLTFGRIGALMGNLIFGYLIELNCYIPIGAFSFLLLLAGILSYFLPLGEDPDEKEEEYNMSHPPPNPNTLQFPPQF